MEKRIQKLFYRYMHTSVCTSPYLNSAKFCLFRRRGQPLLLLIKLLLQLCSAFQLLRMLAHAAALQMVDMAMMAVRAAMEVGT